eukprot:symbB.v1.2.004077.t1/scaffold200.1/size464218/7
MDKAQDKKEKTERLLSQMTTQVQHGIKRRLRRTRTPQKLVKVEEEPSDSEPSVDLELLLSQQQREERLRRKQLKKSVAKFDKWMANYLEREGLKPPTRLNRPQTAPAMRTSGAARGIGYDTRDFNCHHYAQDVWNFCVTFRKQVWWRPDMIKAKMFGDSSVVLRPGELTDLAELRRVEPLNDERHNLPGCPEYVDGAMKRSLSQSQEGDEKQGGTGEREDRLVSTQNAVMYSARPPRVSAPPPCTFSRPSPVQQQPFRVVTGAHPSHGYRPMTVAFHGFQVATRPPLPAVSMSNPPAPSVRWV